MASRVIVQFPATSYGLPSSISLFKNKVKPDFVKDRRRVKREYNAYNAREEIKAMKLRRQAVAAELDGTLEPLKIARATWMADGTHWPGTWDVSSSEHSRSDHSGIIMQVMLKPPSEEPLHGTVESSSPLDFTEVDINLPMLVYVSREKRLGYDHNKKKYFSLLCTEMF